MISGNFLALELHIDWLGDRQLIEKRVFHSGMYHYEILEANRIEMKSIIGAAADPDGMTRFQQTGFTRRYQLEIDADRMTWIRDDGQRTVFERMAGSPAKRDIYGRLIPEKPAADAPATDEKAPATGEKAPAKKPPSKE
jgi:hypothetical protein